MRIGGTLHSTDLAMSPVELAREAEERGYYSLYLPEHTHIPTSRRTPAPTGEEVLGEEYKRSFDPCVALAAPRRAQTGSGSARASRSSHSTIRSPLRSSSRHSTSSQAVGWSLASATAGTERRWSTTAWT